jgi:site-specific DNA-cytosine methylase
VFIIGHLGERCFRQVFPIGEGNRNLDAKDINVVGSLEGDGWDKRHEQIRRVHGTDGISPTIPTGTGGGVMTKILNEHKIRRLTPTECERLQGLPDGWTDIVSDSQRYKCCGNAVTTNVITSIFEKILTIIGVDESEGKWYTNY